MNLDDYKKNWKNYDTSSETNSLTQEELSSLVNKRNKKSSIKLFSHEIILIAIFLYLIVFLIAFTPHLSAVPLKILSIVYILILISQIALIYYTSKLFLRKTELNMTLKKTLDSIKMECEKLGKLYSVITFVNLIILLLSIVLLPKIYMEELSSTQFIFSSIFGVLVLGIFSYKMYIYYRKLMRNNMFLNQKISIDNE